MTVPARKTNIRSVGMGRNALGHMPPGELNDPAREAGLNDYKHKALPTWPCGPDCARNWMLLLPTSVT